MRALISRRDISSGIASVIPCCRCTAVKYWNWGNVALDFIQSLRNSQSSTHSSVLRYRTRVSGDMTPLRILVFMSRTLTVPRSLASTSISLWGKTVRLFRVSISGLLASRSSFCFCRLFRLACFSPSVRITSGCRVRSSSTNRFSPSLASYIGSDPSRVKTSDLVASFVTLFKFLSEATRR